MKVQKRNGSLEPVDLNKIVRAVSRCAEGLTAVDAMRIATRTISGLYDGASTSELDRLSIQTAASITAEEPQYSKLAARLLSTYIDKEVQNQEIHSFSQSIKVGHELGLINDRTAQFVSDNARKLNDTIDNESSGLFEYFGLRTVYDRYLLKHPQDRHVIETPQYFFMRVACGLAQSPGEARDFYRLISSLRYLPSSPTLFNSGTKHQQLSSCYLLDSPQDDLESIYGRYQDIARLSKFAGGIGVAYHRVRSRGSLIQGTNGESNGIVPWLKTLDSSVAAVNQGGRRKGAACVYLESWHADIEEFLELRDNTGDEARRTHNLNLANWISDLFMKRVEQDAMWSLFDPKRHPRLTDTFGEEFEKLYLEGRGERRVRAPGQGARPLQPDDAHPRADRERLDDLQGHQQPDLQPGQGRGQRRPPLQPLHRDPRGHLEGRDRRVQPRLGQPRQVRGGRRQELRLRRARQGRAHRGQVPRPRHRHQLLPHRRGLGLEQPLAPRGARLHGAPGRALQDAHPLRRPRGGEDDRAHPGARLLPRGGDVGGARREERRPRRLRGHLGRRRQAPVRPARRHADPHRGVGRAEGEDRQDRPAQLAHRGDRADGDHREHRRLLRVHRAPGLEPLQARDALRRLPADQQLPRLRPARARALDRGDARPHQGGRGLDPGHRGAAGGPAHALPHRVGAAAEGAHRHGGRPRPVHRPEPEPQPLHGHPDHREALQHVPVRLEAGPEDDLLPALSPRDAHPADLERRGGRRASPTPRRSPAPWRTRRAARPASSDPRSVGPRSGPGRHDPRRSAPIIPFPLDPPSPAPRQGATAPQDPNGPHRATAHTPPQN